MKAFALIALTCGLFLSNHLFAQETPITRLEGTEEEEQFEPQIEFRGIASVADIHVFPSSNYQSEESITINPVDLNNLLIGANVKVPGQPIYKQGYYYTFDGGYNWDGDDFLPGQETPLPIQRSCLTPTVMRILIS